MIREERWIWKDSKHSQAFGLCKTSIVARGGGMLIESSGAPIEVITVQSAKSTRAEKNRCRMVYESNYEYGGC